MGKVLNTTKHLPYEKWLRDWNGQLIEPADKLQVPAAATRITSPLIADNWCTMLRDYPNRPLADFFITGIQEGFRISYNPSATKVRSAKQNLQCALEHPEVVESYLAEEVALGHVSGPFSYFSVLHARISRFGVIPKNNKCTIFQ